MDDYYNFIDESCWVYAKRDTNFKKMKINELKKGDSIIVATNEMEVIERNGFKMEARRTAYAKVKFIVRIEKNSINNLIKFMDSDLMVTKKQPIRMNGQWQLSEDLIDDIDIVQHPSDSKYLYNLILDEDDVNLFVNNVECAPFGYYINDIWNQIFEPSEVVRYVESIADENGLATVNFKTMNVLLKKNKI